MNKLYNSVCQSCSELITKEYSTSFSMGIRVFDAKFRSPIYAIYGFVRFADEIVDTFENVDNRDLLERFRKDTYLAIEEKVSLNPILHSFQRVVNEYDIDHQLIEAFLDSMAMDLTMDAHDEESYKQYIYGSAEVVGLMCLHVFLGGNKSRYAELVTSACALGSAFQKVNFLRDMKSDFLERGRVYFPDVDFENFTDHDKQMIEADIQSEFDLAYTGIVQLPKGVKLGVYTAFKYYLSLFEKIKNNPKENILEDRIRIPNGKKLYLLTTSALKNSLNLL